jgi:hypothetical protein
VGNDAAGSVHPAAGRVSDALTGSTDPAETLARVSGADLTSFLLDVMQRRAAAVSPADVMRRLHADRLVEPGTVDARALHRAVVTLLDALPAEVEVVELSPVAPLGTCSSIATVDQKKIVSTVRAVEVAADPTNLLAAIAAGRDEPDVRLAAVQRVLRTQPFGPVGQQHFTVLGLVTAGRDRGNLDAERRALVETTRTIAAALDACRVGPIEVRVTSLRDRFTDALVGDVRAALPAAVSVVADPDRQSGRGYYRDVCFKVVAHPGPDEIELGDGGCTDWAAQLTGDRKRRLLVAGLGVDRIAATFGA